MTDLSLGESKHMLLHQHMVLQAFLEVCHLFHLLFCFVLYPIFHCTQVELQSTMPRYSNVTASYGLLLLVIVATMIASLPKEI